MKDLKHAYKDDFDVEHMNEDHEDWEEKMKMYVVCGLTCVGEWDADGLQYKSEREGCAEEEEDGGRYVWTPGCAGAGVAGRANLLSESKKFGGKKKK